MARTDDGVGWVEYECAAVAVSRLEVILPNLLVPVPQPCASQRLPIANQQDHNGLIIHLKMTPKSIFSRIA
jgi:hypothetical protein